MNGWLDKEGRLELCPSHESFLSSRNMTEEAMLKAGFIKLTPHKWVGADLLQATDQQVRCMIQYQHIYNLSVPHDLRHRHHQLARRAA